MTICTYKSNIFTGIEKKKYLNVFDFIIEDSELVIFIEPKKGLLTRLKLGNINDFDRVFSLRD